MKQAICSVEIYSGIGNDRVLIVQLYTDRNSESSLST